MTVSEFVIAMLGFGALAFGLIAWGKVYWRKRLVAWAKTHDMVLVDFRGAKFFEGPGRFLRSENQSAFHVRVRDSRGKIRTAWVVMGQNWNPVSAPDELIEERWD